MGIHAAWERYEEWNRVLARALFTPSNEGRPVYLDMDDDVLAEIAEAAVLEQSDIAPQLFAAVRGTLNLDVSDGPVFARHLQKLRQWRGSLRRLRQEGRQPGPPPVLGLLSALTLVAEAMQRDAEFASNAYYPRLLRLLEVPAHAAARVKTGYGEHAEELWRGLNEWLVVMDGQLGLPTAYAVTSRYVGLPVSQALVRSADRTQFPLMFQRYGLPAGGEVSPDDMATLLDDWIGQAPCPVSRGLQSLWTRGQAKERISSVAAIELRNWDGATRASPGDSARAGAVRLLCLLTRFPRSRMQMSFITSVGAQAAELSEVTVLSAPDHPAIGVVQVPGSRVQPGPGSRFDAAQLLEGLLQLEVPGDVTLSRFPRRIVPFRKDDLLNTFVECDRVQLGDEAMVLVKNDSGLLDRAKALIEETARPGFRVETAVPGMPEGWTLFTGVQIAVHTGAGLPGGDLNALVPLLSSQLTITGGSKLPGRMRKWSSLDPPQILATAHGASSIKVTMAPMDSGSPAPGLPRTWTSTTGALLAELGDLELRDGDYELTLARGTAVVQQAALRLRSSDTPDAASGQQVQPLVHALDDDPLSALRAVPESEALGKRFVRGPVSPASRSADGVPEVVAGGIWWAKAKPAQSAVAYAAPAQLTAHDPKSCAVTGAHRYQLPTFYGHKRERERAQREGKTRSAVIEGACETCGFVRPFPAFIPRWQQRKPNGQDLWEPVADLTGLPAVESTEGDWVVAIDNVMHAGGGGHRTLEYVARQVEDSALFAGTFAQVLESRGDIEIRRDRDLKPVEWAATPPCLAELATGEFMLTGRWTVEAFSNLAVLSEKAGGRLEEPLDPAGVPVYAVSGVSASQIAHIAAEAGAYKVIPNAAELIAASLPPLSQVLGALHRVPMPVARRIERYHLASSSWVRVSTAIEPGAYRLESNFMTTYLVRTSDDIAVGAAAVATSHLAKHLAALLAGRPLLAYNADKRALYVPIGADLPGLYGRAAVLCSGRQALPAPKYRTQTYRAVPRSVAGHLTRALTS